MIIIPNILYILGLSPIKKIDITPVFLGPAGLITAWEIFRFKLFDLVPLARAAVIQTMDAGMMVLDIQDRVIDINPAFERIVGLTASQISARRVEEVCCKIPELVNACTDRNCTHAELSIKEKEEAKAYELFLSSLTDSKGRFIGRLVLAYEITEKKKAQQAILKQQWQLAVIEERERMAKDLHDNLGQVLGFINLQAQGIKQELINAEVDIASHRLDKLVNVTQLAHSELREYIRNVRDAASREKEFITSLEKYILHFEEHTGIRVKLDIPRGFTGEELEPDIRFNMLNMVKEALNNVGKHAEAYNVKISFTFGKGQLCAAIEDDGKGFDVIHYGNGDNRKFGLNIMKERAAEIGAKIDIASAPGKGTMVAFCVPVGEGENDNEIDAGR